jgi:site-specific recombinase XerD
MRQAGDDRHGRRMRGLIVVLWRAGLRIHEALTLTVTDLNGRRGSLLIRHGKGDRRREVGMDPWAWSVLAEWTADRIALPAGPLFCVIGGPTRGRAWSATAVRAELRHLAIEAAVRRRFAPHQYADVWVMPMRRRVALCGGEFAVMSRHNRGAVELRLPLDVG